MKKLSSFSTTATRAFCAMLLCSGILHGQDVSIFTANTAGESITTADFTHDFDTTVRADGAHTLTGGTDIQLSAGHHLVIYNSRFDRTGGGSNRTETQSNLNLAGVDLPIGWSQGYTRWDNNQKQTITSGGAIIDVASAGDILQLQSFRTDDNGGATQQRLAGATGIQLIKFDDDLDYLRLDAAGADPDQSLPADTTTWRQIAYDNVLEKDTGSFEFTASGSDITLVQQGHYLVFANTYIFENAERDGFVQRLTLNDVEVSGSRTSVYIRGNQNSCSEGATSLGMIIETTAPNQILNVELLQDVGRAGNIVGNRTGISIVKLPEEAEYIRLQDVSGEQDLNAEQTLVYDDADSQLEIGGAFSHNTSVNPGRVGINTNGDYLFFAQQYDDNDGVQRGFYNQGWQVNGSGGYAAHGQTGRYSRDSGGTDKFGNWSGFISALSATDYVETLTRPLGNSGTNSADTLAIQGFRFDNVLGPDVYPPAIVEEYPADDSTNAYIGADLVLTFDEGIALTGGGTITLVANPNGSPSNTVIDLSIPGSGVSVDGAQLIINPSSNLVSGTEYAVLISNDAIEDLSIENGGSANLFPGISDTATWSFTTGLLDSTPPDISTTMPTVPVDNAIGVTVDSQLQVTFDDPIFRGAGNIYLYDVTNGAVQQTIAVTDESQVSFSGNTMIITPAVSLGSAVEMAVQWDAGIVRNFSDYGNLALTDTTTWNFTTTQASLSNSIFIYNHSFEADSATDGQVKFTTLPTSWSVVTNNGITDYGVWNPDSADFTDEAPEGSNISFVLPQQLDTEAGFSQIMADVHGGEDYPAEYNFIHGPDYQLKVKIGDAKPNPFAGYKVQLLAGGELLAEDVYSQVVPDDSFIEVTLGYAYDPANAALNGEPLEIRLLTLGDPVGGGSVTIFDDVRLTYGFTVPAADAGGPYVVTPSYNLELDGSNSRPSDGQTISLYEWDLNNDGVFGDVDNVAQPTAITDAELISNHGMSLGDNTIALRVTDSAGLVSVISDTVRIDLASVTPGADFVLIADEDSDGDDRWEDVSSGGSGLELLLDGTSGVARTAALSGMQIQYAYDFPGGLIGNAGGGLLVSSVNSDPKSFQDAPGDWSTNAMTMEIWFKPDNLAPTPANGQIIFEDGGGSGLGLFIANDELVLGQDSNDPLISYNLVLDPSTLFELPPMDEFIQAVVTRTAAGFTTLYINGQPVGTASDDSDWSGGDEAAFGTRGGANTGGRGGGQSDTESFDGQIAIVRVYDSQVLSDAQVLDNFNTVNSPDIYAPFVENMTPPDDSTGVLTNTNIIATFDSDIVLTGSGTLTIKNLDDGSGSSDVVITLAESDPAVTLQGRDLIIDPTSNLDFGTNYAINISSGALTDTASTPNEYGGIADDTIWNFRTLDQDFSAPVLVGMSPPDNATDVPVAGLTLVASFDDDLLLGSGDITITDLTDGSTTQTISVTDASQVTVSGKEITIVPTTPLSIGKQYAISMDAGVVSNTSYLDFGGIADNTTWNFTLNSPLFFENFESPVVSNYSQGTIPDNGNWIRSSQGYGSGNCGIINDSVGTFEDLTGDQAFAFRYTNSGLTTAVGKVGSFTQGVTYTVSFDVVADGSALPYSMQLLAAPITFDEAARADARADGDATELVAKTGNAIVGSYKTISFDYTATAGDDGQDIVLRFKGATTSAHIDNVSVTVASTPDTTAPELVNITNPGGESDLTVGDTEVFTLTFSEDIDAITVMADDFTNYGTASFSIGTIAETSDSSGIFTVPVTMTSIGTFQLQIAEGAVIKDMAGNTLDTGSAINDDVTINVIAGSNPYGSWASGPFDGTLSDTTTSLDFDGGGLATGLEWVLGGDPTLASDDVNIMPTFDASGASSVSFTFRRATAARDDSNTAIAVTYGNDMKFSSTAVDGVDEVTIQVTGNPEPGVELVTVTIPKGTNDRLFVRLEVSITTP